MIYFDYNATAPVMREAREAWLNVTEKIGGNPSSMHQFGTKAAIVLADGQDLVNQARPSPGRGSRSRW